MTKPKFDYAAAFWPREGQPLNPPPVFNLDYWAECDAPEFERLVEAVRDRMQAALPVQRWSEERTCVVRLLLCNFIQNHHRQKGRGTRYYRSPRRYAGKTHYRPDFVSGKVLPAVVDALEAADLAYAVKGQWDVLGVSSRMSQAGPRPELITLWEELGVVREMVKPSTRRPLIELRSEKRRGRSGREKVYDLIEPPRPPCAASARLYFLRKKLERINAHIAEFELWVPEDARWVEAETGDHWHLDEGGWRKAPDDEAGWWIDLADNQLRRVFNNVNPETYDLDCGGRFYGGWWQSIGRDHRPDITINGEPTVELDYGSFHPRMIYHRAGIDNREDLYALGCAGQIAPGFDAVKLRKAVKVLWLVALNSNAKSLAAARRGAREEVLENWGIELPEGLHPSDVIDWIKLENEPVADRFGTGVGVRLQAIDAAICEDILMAGIGKGIPILPIHDSFIVPASAEDDLRYLMTYHYQSKLRFAPVIERKEGPAAIDPGLIESISVPRWLQSGTLKSEAWGVGYEG